MDSDYRQFAGVWEKAKIGTAEDKQVKLKTQYFSHLLEFWMADIWKWRIFILVKFYRLLFFDFQSLKRYDFELIGVTPDYRAVENRDLWHLPAYNEGKNRIL